MNLPDLRILPLAQLVPHEKTDARRVNPLIERLKSESVLNNPPIVAPFGNGDPRFVVLDGANRTSAFAALSVPHVLAQVVNYEAVELKVWHHVITNCSMEDLMTMLRSIVGLSIREANLMSARAALARREALAFISCDRDPKTDLLIGGDDLRSRTDLLNKLVDAYEGCAKVQRTTSDNLLEARNAFPDASAVVVSRATSQRRLWTWPAPACVSRRGSPGMCCRYAPCAWAIPWRCCAAHNPSAKSRRI